MPSIVAVAQNYGEWDITAEADLSAGAAVTATRGDNITCVKNGGTGSYTFTIKGTSSLMMYEVLCRQADLSGTPATVFWAKVISVTQTASTGDIAVVVQTLNNAATPAALDTTGACQLSIYLALRTIRMGNPL